MNRRDDLLTKAADALDDMRDPFDHSFLVEHGVTLDECGDLSEDLALGARLVKQLHRDVAAGGARAHVAVMRMAGAVSDGRVGF